MLLFLKITNVCAKILKLVVLITGLSLLLCVGLQVAGRYIPFVPRWLWPLEITNFSLVWMIFTGSILALREKEHFTVDLFSGFFQKRKLVFLSRILDILYYCIGFTITFIFIYYGYQYFMDWGTIHISDILLINMGWLYVSVPVAGIFWFIFLIETLLKDVFRINKPKENS